MTAGEPYSEAQQRVLQTLYDLEEQIKPGCLAHPARKPQAESKVLARLEAGHLAALLSAGPDEANRIFEYVPRTLAALLLGQRARTIEEAVKLVANNLDWYLKPPAPLWRDEWLSLALSVLGLFICTICVVLQSAGMTRYSPELVVMPPFFIAFIWVANYGDAKRHLWIKSLNRYIRETYAASAAEE